MFTGIFEKLKNNKELVCLYCNKYNLENFMCGYILGYDNNFVLFNGVTPDGEDDGIILRKQDDIVMLEYCNLYTEELKKVVLSSGYKLQKELNKNIMMDILSYAKERNLIVSIQLKNSAVIAIQGFVYSFSDVILIVHSVDTNGYDDGFSVCKLNDITLLSFDGIEEKILEKNNQSVNQS